MPQRKQACADHVKKLTLGNPLLINCSIAIWAVASCIATRSGLSRKYVSPLTMSCTEITIYDISAQQTRRRTFRRNKLGAGQTRHRSNSAQV